MEWTEKFYDMLQNKVGQSLHRLPRLSVGASYINHHLEYNNAGWRWQAQDALVLWREWVANKLHTWVSSSLKVLIADVLSSPCHNTVLVLCASSGREPASDDEKTQLIDTLQDWKSEKYQAGHIFSYTSHTMTAGASHRSVRPVACK